MRRWAVVPVVFAIACAEEGGKKGGDFDKAPDFSLEDVNPTSELFGARISPRDEMGEVSVWYFGHADCPICSKYFGELDVMQQELLAEGYAIHIYGINAAGKDHSNDLITDGRDLPWLQDTAADDVWGEWLADWRDLVVLDANNELAWRQNLTDHDITLEANYADVKQRILDAQ